MLLDIIRYRSMNALILSGGSDILCDFPDS
jgi:hypothetical protein